MNDLTARIDQTLKSCEGHTAGPWMYRSREHDDWGTIRSADGAPVANARHQLSVRELHAHRDAGTDPTEANSLLIASAPTLRALLVEARAQIAAQAEALAAERERANILAWNNDGHAEWMTEHHQDLLRELPDSETTAQLGRLLARWQRTPGQRQYLALSEVEHAHLYAVVSETTQGYRFDGLHTQPEGAQQHQREVIAAEAGKLIMTDVYALVRVQTQENTLGAQS